MLHNEQDQLLLCILFSRNFCILLKNLHVSDVFRSRSNPDDKRRFIWGNFSDSLNILFSRARCDPGLLIFFGHSKFLQKELG